MTLRLYDLAGAEDARRISPFCWRVRLALAHKGLDVQTLPWRMTEKDAIASSGQGKVPVLLDGDRIIADSWAILQYLDTAYPDRPLLFAGGTSASGGYAFIRHWTDGELVPAVARIVVPDFYRHLHAKDQPFFRQTREPMFGTTIEAMIGEIPARIEAFRGKLGPLRRRLAEARYVSGEAPGLSDYLIFSVFIWARSVSAQPLVASEDPINPWIGNMLDAHGGLGRAAPGYEMAA